MRPEATKKSDPFKKMHPGGLATLVNTSGWGISLDWTEEEQKTLESYMNRYPAERMDPLQRYVRIAFALPRKNVRDIALRVRWTNMNAQLKRRTGLDPRGAPGMPPLPLPGPKPLMQMGPPGGPQHAHHGGGGGGGGQMPPYMGPPPPAGAPGAGGAPPGASSMPNEGPNTIEGPISYLLDANLAILNHFRSNMTAFKVHENTQLLVQFRDNILQILQAMEYMGGVMAEMPPLPIRLNMDLANSFLPSRPAGVLTYDGMMMPPPPQPALNAPGMVPLNGPGIAPGAAAAATVPATPVPVPTGPAAVPPPPGMQKPPAMGIPPALPGSHMNPHPHPHSHSHPHHLGGAVQQPVPVQQQQPGVVPQMRPMGPPPMQMVPPPAGAVQLPPPQQQPLAAVGVPPIGGGVAVQHARQGNVPQPQQVSSLPASGQAGGALPPAAPPAQQVKSEEQM